MRILVRIVLLAAAVAFAAVFAALPAPPHGATAHPLGNFTINHYDRITVSDSGIDVYRVLDMAEIPATEERLQRIDWDGNGTIDDQEAEAWALPKIDELARNMVLTVDGKRSDLSPAEHELTFPQGAGGLNILRLTVTYHAVLPEGWHDRSPSVQFEDKNYPGRIGWREIIVVNGAGAEVFDASAPAVDQSNELLSFPQGSLSSPLDVQTASFSFRAVAGAQAAPTPDHKQQQAVRGNPDSTLSRYANLIAKDHLSAGVITIALLLALGFGAIHALSPGHGKTIVAAYLIGSRGTAKHALLLGLTVTATHTSSVYALGFITLYLSEYIVPETLYPWLGISSGALIVLMGLSLFVGRLRSSGLLSQGVAWLASRLKIAPRRTPAFAMASSEAGALMVAHSDGTPAHEHGDGHAHDHGGDAHDHGAHGRDGEEPQHEHDASEHRHGFGPSHSHAIPGQDGEPVTWQRLVGLGIFGGLLPCPSAIVVMLSAIALHRVGFGLILILAFSLGLAGVLTGIGFALVYARTITQRVPLLQRLVDGGAGTGWAALAVRAFPVGSAAAVMIAGLFVTLRAVGQL